MVHEHQPVEKPMLPELAGAEIGRVVLWERLIDSHETAADHVRPDESDRHAGVHRRHARQHAGEYAAHHRQARREITEDENPERTKYLEGIRFQIRSLDSEERTRLNDYLDEAAPPFARVRQRDEAKLTSWSSWLTNTATDRQLTRFLHWHTDTVVEQTSDPEVQMKIKVAKAAYVEKLQDWYSRGIIPSPEVFEKARNTKMYIGDVFSTLVVDRLGHHEYGTDHVVVRQGIGATAEDRKADLLSPKSFDTILHELNHAVFKGFPDMPWLNEAVTEYMAVAMRQEIMRGTEYEHLDTLSYGAERELMFATGLTPQQLVRAYASGGLGELKVRLNLRWGVPGALEAIDSQVRHEMNVSMNKRGKSEAVAQRNATKKVAYYLQNDPTRVFGEAAT